MGLLAEVREAQQGKRAGGSRCRICVLIEEMPQPDAKDLAEVVADPAIFASTIIEVLRQRGIEVTDPQIGNHRRNHVPTWVRR